MNCLPLCSYFYPLYETPELIIEATMEDILEDVMSPENRQELLELLTDRYLDSIKQLSLSGAFEIAVLIDTAEQLLTVAKQTHCSLLAAWASTLKNQAELFDITNLSRTLSGFEKLLNELK